MTSSIVSIFQLLSMISLVIFSGLQFHLADKIIIPINMNIAVMEDTTISKNLERLGAPKERINELSSAIRLASRETNINENLILALMYTESSFNPNARSYGNGGKYKGLMQTPTASFIYADVDALHGARILKDKLRITDGRLLDALALYKGGRNKVAYRQAQETLNLYKLLEV